MLDPVSISILSVVLGLMIIVGMLIYALDQPDDQEQR